MNVQTKPFFRTIKAEVNGFVHFQVEARAWSNAFNFPLETSLQLYALKDIEIFVTWLAWGTKKFLQVTISHVAIFQASDSCNHFLKLRNSYRGNQVVTLLLEAKRSKNREHVS